MYYFFHNINYLKTNKNVVAVAITQGGIGRLSTKTALNRESLYKTLSSKGNPKLTTIRLLLKGMGFKLSISPCHRKAS